MTFRRSLLLILSPLFLVPGSAAPPPTGGITRHVWTGFGGGSVSDLTSRPTFSNSPNQTGVLTSFSAPVDSADDYGSRVFGWVHAPVTGNYRFYIHSDDSSELWLGTTASPDGKRKIAEVSGYTGNGEWTKSPSQTSALISLEAGKFYYIEALHKEGGGGDNLGVGWTYPGSPGISYIPGSRLSQWQNTAPLAANDSVFVYVNTAAVIRVLDNDVEPNGKANFNVSSLTITVPPAQGTAVVEPGGKIRYTHTGTGTGNDSLTYRIADLAGLTATATVQLQITDDLRLPLASSRMPAAPPPQQISAVNAFPALANFSDPLALATAPGETNRLFIVEKGGDIEVIRDLAAPANPPVPFLNLDSIVNGRGELFQTSGECGLLGLAFHPQYATNKRFFVYYSVKIGSVNYQRVSEFARSAADANLADPNSEKIFIQQADDYDNHNGGCIHFGPDGYLYISMGDEGDQNDAGDNSQRIDKDFWSSMSRIDVNVDPANYAANPNLRPNNHASVVLEPVSGNPRYKVPLDNPFVGATTFNGLPVTATNVRTEFWAVGLRNPWRFSFDGTDLWCGDVGGGSWEEINKIVKGGNYGWAFREGNDTGPKWNSRPANWAGALPPLYAYGHGSGSFQGNSVTGGVVYRGTRIPSLTGRYIFSDYSSGNIWSLNPATNPVTVERLSGEGAIAGFGLDPSNGDVLMADLNGQVRRLITQAVDTDFPATLSDTGLFADVTTLTPNSGLVEYAVNLPFWSDHAKKRRWFGIPETTSKLVYRPEGTWETPVGTVWVKHFDMEMTRGNPATAKRLETRVLVRNAGGSYGVSYRWNAGGTEAALAAEAGEEFDLSINVGGPSPVVQRWRIPSRSDCMTCHTPQAGHSLSFHTRQLNAPGQIAVESGNFIQLLADAGYLQGLNEDPSVLPKHVATDDASYSLEARARAWLDVNCAYCHMAGGTAPAQFDVRVEVPLFLTKTVNVTPTSGTQHPDDRLLVPGHEERSVIVHRTAVRNGYTRMPPLGSNVTDSAGVQLLKDWIGTDLAGRRSFAAWTSAELGGRPPEDQAADADPDGDGRSNHTEFLEHTDPLAPDGGPVPGAIVDGDLFRFTFPDLRGRGMILESSANLTDWSKWPVDGNDGLERAPGMPWEVEIPISSGKRFFRAQVEER